ncbi:uncharacterized protein THITE_151206 [Thermothielavioides terrestris NRRL 8126]|uniref:Uncharacterized protein n=1 Tax=Thermothielavioides terrestris (strain ATCC 38088 / NRRL 8126) TaxID=578455 RepID=G2R0A9_THETT|nr:uncharacterized protein THITE_151206 [Thermothielavioides terrestris NRRL 8126]AEO67277.1 hypothetical protein THITE_151206 [Thermothielavioides terrestris NRRL 8126]
MNQFTDPNNTTVFVGGLSSIRYKVARSIGNSRVRLSWGTLAPRWLRLARLSYWVSHLSKGIDTVKQIGHNPNKDDSHRDADP